MKNNCDVAILLYNKLRFQQTFIRLIENILCDDELRSSTSDDILLLFVTKCS